MRVAWYVVSDSHQTLMTVTVLLRFALQGSQTATEIFCFATLTYPIAAAYYGLYK